ncbi:ras family-domain-containing protein [Rhizoctonia solani]|nr:ras family-domain-containing protein [Rhizoctonia solani]
MHKIGVAILPLGRDEDAYYQFKIIVIGPSGVGKTMNRADTLEATTKNHMDISNRFISSDGTLLKAELWDTDAKATCIAGQERYRSVTQSNEIVNGVLLVYNLTKKETFKACEDWRKDLENKVADFEQVQVVLVGNQLDLEEQREVSTEEAQAYAGYPSYNAALIPLDRHGFEFAEVSAKEGANVETTFQNLMDDLEISSAERWGPFVLKGVAANVEVMV